MTTPNTRSEDRSCLGIATKCVAKPVDASTFHPWGIISSKGDTPCEFLCRFPLPSKMPTSTHPYLAADGAESSGEGQNKEGEVNSFNFSQLVKARGEAVAPLHTKPGLGTNPAARGEQQPTSSSSNGFNSSGLDHLPLHICTAWPALLGSLSPS